MQNEFGSQGVSRRSLLAMIGMTAGGAAMYQAMTSLGFAAESGYTGPIKLDGDPKGASVLVLGAGLAGMTAALELRQAGYKVQMLEFNDAGGRAKLDAARRRQLTPNSAARRQKCEFDAGTLFQSRPVAHSLSPQRDCSIIASASASRSSPSSSSTTTPILHSTQGASAASRSASATSRPISRAMSPSCWPRSTQQGKLEDAGHQGGSGDPARGAASRGARSTRTTLTRQGSTRRVARLSSKDPGGGLGARARSIGEPIGLSDVLNSRLWRRLANFALYEFQTTMFQPVGGMDMIGKAFAKRARRPHPIQCQGHQDRSRMRSGVTVDVRGYDGARHDRSRPAPTGASAPFRFTILSQIEMNVGATDAGGDRSGALCVVGQGRPAIQAPLLGRGRGDLSAASATPICRSRQISYPSTGFNKSGKGVLARRLHMEWRRTPTSSPPWRRRSASKRAVEYRRADPSAIPGTSSRPALRSHGTACRLRSAAPATGPRRRRKEHYDNLCQIDGRIVLAGEHASYIPAWKEGAILSALDAISRLHKRVLAS